MDTETLQPPQAERPPAPAVQEQQISPEQESFVTLKSVSALAKENLTTGGGIEEAVNVTMDEMRDLVPNLKLSSQQEKALLTYLADDGSVSPEQLPQLVELKVNEYMESGVGEDGQPYQKMNYHQLLEDGLVKHLAETAPKSFMDAEVPEEEQAKSFMNDSAVAEAETFIDKAEKEENAPKTPEEFQTTDQLREALLPGVFGETIERESEDMIARAEGLLTKTNSENLKVLAAELIAEEKLKMSQEKARKAEEAEFDDIGLAAPPSSEEAVPSINKTIEEVAAKAQEKTKAEEAPYDPDELIVIEDDEPEVEHEKSEPEIENVPASLREDLGSLITYMRSNLDQSQIDPLQNLQGEKTTELSGEVDVAAMNMLLNQMVKLYTQGGPKGESIDQSQTWTPDTKKKLSALVQQMEVRNPLSGPKKAQATKKINKLKQTLGIE